MFHGTNGNFPAKFTFRPPEDLQPQPYDLMYSISTIAFTLVEIQKMYRSFVPKRIVETA